MSDNWFPPFSVRNLAHIYHRFTPELYPGISNRRDKGGRKVLCKLVQDSIVVSGRNYPSGLRTTGARVDRISTRSGTLSTVCTGFPEHSLGLLPLPQWGLSVWNHVPWVLLTSQLRFRRNVDQVSGVATSHKPFTQPLTGKKGSFLWDRKYLLRFVTARPLMSGGTSRRGWCLSMPPSDCRMTSEPPMAYSRSLTPWVRLLNCLP